MPREPYRRQRIALLAIALCATLACTVVSTATPEPSVVPTLTVSAVGSPTARATPSRTATRWPTRTPIPAGTPTAIQVSSLAALAAATPLPGQSMTVTLTAAELNAALSFADLQVSGASVGDPVISLEEGSIVARLPVTVTSPAMTLDVLLRGTPNVVEGAMYVAVDSVTLGENTAFLTRLVAQGMVDSAIRDYSGENGIPIPMDALNVMEVTSAAAHPGILAIEGVARLPGD